MFLKIAHAYYNGGLLEGFFRFFFFEEHFSLSSLLGRNQGHELGDLGLQAFGIHFIIIVLACQKRRIKGELKMRSWELMLIVGVNALIQL